MAKSFISRDKSLIIAQDYHLLSLNMHAYQVYMVIKPDKSELYKRLQICCFCRLDRHQHLRHNKFVDVENVWAYLV